jgi:hypothetical protein
MQTLNLQQALDYVESLSSEEQDLLIEIIQKRRIEQRRKEIAADAKQTLKAVELGTVKRGTIKDLMADLLEEE